MPQGGLKEEDQRGLWSISREVAWVTGSRGCQVPGMGRKCKESERGPVISIY